MSAADAANSVIDAYNEKLNSVAPGAVLIQLGLMAALSAAGLLAFSVLRPTNSMIYQPKVKYSEDGKRPPKIDKGFLSWVKPLLTTKEDDLIDVVGLDAICFMRLLRMCMYMLGAIAVLTCGALLPVNIAYNLSKVNSNSRNYLSLLTIQNVRGNLLWIHVAITYVITAVIFFFIWRSYSRMVALRWRWFRSEEYQSTLHARSLMVTQVAKLNQSDQGIASLLQSLNVPYPTTAIHIARPVGTLPELIEQHNDAVRKLEGVLTKYFKNPDRLPSHRPTLTIGGFMGLGGRKVDAVDYLTQKIKRLEERVEVARSQVDGRKAENYGFASFAAVPYAHVVAKRLKGKRKNGSRFELAPAPKDIIWKNITMDDKTRGWNKFVGGMILVVFCFFYLIPLLAVSLLANLAVLATYVPFIQTWSNNYSFLFSAFVGIVPPVLSFILQLILPVVLRWISQYQGAITFSQGDRNVTARYSAFLLISQFLVFSVLGVFVQVIVQVVQEIQGRKSVSAIFDYLSTVPDKFQQTWVIQSTYWLTVFPLRGASSIFDLAQFFSLLTVWVRSRLFGRTPREIRDWTKPPEFDYAVYISNHLFLLTVGFVYAPLAPLVVVFAAAAFFVSIWVYKYQLMYVNVSRVESGGRLWRVAINRILAAAMLMHALMLLTMGLQRGWFNAIALIPALISVIVFKVVLVRTFDTRFDYYIPSEAEMAELAQHSADARKHRLERRFGHPSLHEPLFTPMLHKKVQHLLPTIYDGRIGQSQGMVDGKEVDQNRVGGLTFNMLDEHNLQYDRLAYLRQRDEDEQSISTALGGGSSKEDYLMAARRQEYLRQGPMAGQWTPGATPGEELSAYEFGPVYPNQSQDALIQYPPSYSSPRNAGRAGTHSPSASQISLDYYATPGRSGRTTPGAGSVVELVHTPGYTTPPQQALPPGAAPVPAPGSRTPPFGPVPHGRNASVGSIVPVGSSPYGFSQSSNVPPSYHTRGPSDMSNASYATAPQRRSVDLSRAVQPPVAGTGPSRLPGQAPPQPRTRQMSREEQYLQEMYAASRAQQAQPPGAAPYGSSRSPYTRLDADSTDDITRQHHRR